MGNCSSAPPGCCGYSADVYSATVPVASELEIPKPQTELFQKQPKFRDSKGLAELRNLFDSLDKDHDGKVTGQEWGKKVKEHQTLLAKYFGGSTLKEIGSAFKRIDTDGNASLSWDEFVAAAGLELPAAPSDDPNPENRILLVSDNLPMHEQIIRSAKNNVVVVPVKYDSWDLDRLRDEIYLRAGEPVQDKDSIALFDHGKKGEFRPRVRYSMHMYSGHIPSSLA